jgi:formylglycine-generating enzyme required for sulfatase activity
MNHPSQLPVQRFHREPLACQLLAACLALAACSPDAAIQAADVGADAAAEDTTLLVSDSIDVLADTAATDIAVDVPDMPDVADVPEVAASPDVADAPDAAVADLSDASADAADVADAAPSTPAGMILIPSGTFWMGCNAAIDTECTWDDSPQHKVTLSSYYMDLTETTVGQYKACVDAGVCAVPKFVQPATYATYPGLTDNPVNRVTWTQAQQYCKWRGADYDLPTEAQWEMAARGSCEKNGSTAADPNCKTSMRTYPWGDTTANCTSAVMSNGTPGCGTNATWAVGSKPAGDSPYGLHDMAGSVWESTRDWSGFYSAGDQTDPVGPASASTRVFRGGGLNNDAAYLPAGFRTYYAPPSAAFPDLGLRCSKSFP